MTWRAQATSGGNSERCESGGFAFRFVLQVRSTRNIDLLGLQLENPDPHGYSSSMTGISVANLVCDTHVQVSTENSPFGFSSSDLVCFAEGRLEAGLYCSLMEFANPILRGVPARGSEPGSPADPAAYVNDHMLPQMRDLVYRLEPDLLWTDGDWEFEDTDWRATEFLAWLFNESPIKDKASYLPPPFHLLVPPRA